ncbi:hypothetical protein BRD18_08915 [Halobacteriales archaeon SW_7_71_33]|nr:MAG: hypothetical protein BRD18_08915 [Halobacteriales archaeon SW_7_71_33]
MCVGARARAANPSRSDGVRPPTGADGEAEVDEDELDDGYALTCVAYPREPSTLETGETP